MNGESRPNILFFFTDQQRWDTCGCYGQPQEVTPNLDRAAAEGVRFDLAFTCQPVCGPARAALQTGRWPTEMGCHVNGLRLPAGEPTLATMLGAAGYETGYIGKWHLASAGSAETENFRTRPVPPDRRGGYDYWLASDVLEFTSHSYDGHVFDGDGNRREFPPARYRADALTDWAIEYLESRDRRRPFFLFVSYIEPHHQNDHQHYEGPLGSRDRFHNYVVPGDLKGTGGDWHGEYPDYLGCIHSLDRNFGRLRETLGRLGLGDDTLLIWTSDHGSHFRTRNSEYKRACHDGCLRIPLVLRGPGFTGGKVVPELVSLMDVPPTVVSAGGVAPPTAMRGRPLQGLLAGGAADWPQEIFAQISESQVARAIRTRRWKYSVAAPGKHGVRDAGAERYVEEYLYDLDADPFERNNLAGQSKYADVSAHLRECLIRRMVEAGEPAPVIDPAHA